MSMDTQSQKCRIWSSENPQALHWDVVCTVLKACSWSHLHQDEVEINVYQELIIKFI